MNFGRGRGRSTAVDSNLDDNSGQNTQQSQDDGFQATSTGNAYGRGGGSTLRGGRGAGMNAGTDSRQDDQDGFKSNADSGRGGSTFRGGRGAGMNAGSERRQDDQDDGFNTGGGSNFRGGRGGGFNAGPGRQDNQENQSYGRGGGSTFRGGRGGGMNAGPDRRQDDQDDFQSNAGSGRGAFRGGRGAGMNAGPGRQDDQDDFQSNAGSGRGGSTFRGGRGGGMNAEPRQQYNEGRNFGRDGARGPSNYENDAPPSRGGFGRGQSNFDGNAPPSNFGQRGGRTQQFDNDRYGQQERDNYSRDDAPSGRGTFRGGPPRNNDFQSRGQGYDRQNDDYSRNDTPSGRGSFRGGASGFPNRDRQNDDYANDERSTFASGANTIPVSNSRGGFGGNRRNNYDQGDNNGRQDFGDQRQNFNDDGFGRAGRGGGYRQNDNGRQFNQDDDQQNGYASRGGRGGARQNNYEERQNNYEGRQNNQFEERGFGQRGGGNFGGRDNYGNQQNDFNSRQNNDGPNQRFGRGGGGNFGGRDNYGNQQNDFNSRQNDDGSNQRFGRGGGGNFGARGNYGNQQNDFNSRQNYNDDGSNQRVGRGGGGNFGSRGNYGNPQNDFNSRQNYNDDGSNQRVGRGGGGNFGVGRGAYQNGDRSNFNQEGGRGGFNRNGGGGGGRSCYNCNSEDHISRDCPDRVARPPRKCYNCDGEGHFVNECPEPRRERPTGPIQPREGQFCFNCNDPNHFKSECPNIADKDKTFEPKFETAKELFEKNRRVEAREEMYTEDSEIKIENYKEENISVFADWSDTPFCQKILDNISERGNYVKPREFQSKIMPIIMEGYDVKAKAQTGCGKTAAFLLPIVHKLTESFANSTVEDRMLKVSALVIGPTREVVKQLKKEAVMFADGTDVRVNCTYGKIDMRFTRNSLKEDGCDLLIATPGRAAHLIDDGTLDVSELKFLVLDEADDLLKEFFSLDMQKITGKLGHSDSRQTLFFSATLGSKARELADQYCKPNSVIVKSPGVNGRINQEFVHVPLDSRNKYLIDEIEKEYKENGKLAKKLIFVSSKNQSKLLMLRIGQLKNVKTMSLNGDLAQVERERALDDFAYGDTDVLIGTNLASRGLDVEDLGHVINLQVPQASDEDAVKIYIHRIGRTGRIKKGTATTYFDPTDPYDQEFAPKLIEFFKDNDLEVPNLIRAAVDSSIEVEPPNVKDSNDFEAGGNNWSDDNAAEIGEPEF